MGVGMVMPAFGLSELGAEGVGLWDILVFAAT